MNKTSSDRLNEHFEFVINLLPEINSVSGYIFYTFSCYLIVTFLGWLANPTVDKMRQDYEESREQLQHTLKMRNQNKADGVKIE